MPLGMRRLLRSINKRLGTFDLLPEYFTAAASQMQNILWGALLPFVAWGIWFVVGNPPTWVNATALGVALFLAGYYVWRADHLRLQPAFEITRVIPQTWTDQNTGRHAMAYYFEVINKSETTSILEAEVHLSEITPAVENLEWLPVHLTHKHDRSIPREKTFNLHPGKPKHIDFVSALEKSSQFTVLHIVSDANNQVVGRDRRRLKVTINGKDVPALSAWFDVYFTEDGFFVCEME